jgi:hypothetical protein
VPGQPTCGGFERAKQRIIVQPGGVLRSEDLEGMARFGVPGSLIFLIRPPEDFVLRLVRMTKINAPRIERDTGRVIL